MKIDIRYSVYCNKNKEVVDLDECRKCEFFSSFDENCEHIYCNIDKKINANCPYCGIKMDIFDESDEVIRYSCNRCNSLVTITELEK